MQTAPVGRPARWTMTVVRTAVRLLPAGPLRDRYQQELVAELYGMSPQEQSRHAFSVLLHAPALRAALSNPPHETEITMPARPWRCRFGLHKYVFLWTEDNHRYSRCERCGKDHQGSSSGPQDKNFFAGGLPG